MGKPNKPTKTVRSRPTPKPIHAIQAKVMVNPWFVQLGNLLSALLRQTDGRASTAFNPDIWALQSLWSTFLNDLSFNERLAVSNDLRYEGQKVLKKLFQLKYLVVYDSFTRSVFNTFEKKVMKNTLKTPLLDGFKYIIAFFTFLDNGPKLCSEADALQVDTSFDGNKSYFSMYATIEVLNRALTNIDNHSIDLDLLVFWVNNLDLQDSASIKQLCELPLTKDEAVQTLLDLRTPNSIRKFKERIFHKGPWYTTSALIFTSMNKQPINYSALLNKLLEVKHHGSFEGLKHVQIKESRLQTYFSGLRILTEYQITRQRWLFTDVYEAGLLAIYLSEHIDELSKLSASKSTPK